MQEKIQEKIANVEAAETTPIIDDSAEPKADVQPSSQPPSDAF